MALTNKADSERSFTLDEVRRLVQYTYEVGFCDGIEEDMREYRDAVDFWNKKSSDWIQNPITYLY